MSDQIQFNKIRIANPPLDGNNRTYLTADVDATGTDLPVLSTSGDQFKISGDADYYVITGNYNEEKSEIKLIDAGDAGTDDTGFTVAALSYSHSASEPVTFIQYNQIQIFGAIVSAGTKTLIGTIDIDPSKQFTEFIYEGATYGYFYTAYYNSTDDEIGAYSDQIDNAKFGHNSVKRVINAGLRKAMTYIDENENGTINWDNAIEIVQDGIDEIMARKRKWPFLHKIDTDQETVGDQAFVNYPTDTAVIDFITVNFRRLYRMSRWDYDKYTRAGAVVTTGSPTHYTLKNNKVFFYTTPDQAYDIEFEYYKNPAVIDSLIDTIDQPFIVPLVYYCASSFATIRGNDKRGEKMYSLFEKLLEQQVEEYTGPEQSGEAEYVERTSAYDEEDINVNAKIL